MKLLILIFAAFTGLQVQAQVNLDQPVSVGPTDMVFRSTADEKAVYLIPISLQVQGSPRVSEIAGEYRATFDVGMDQNRWAEISAKVTGFEVRMMRGWNAVMDPAGSVDTPPRFRPRLVPLGDAGNLGTALPYMFAVKKIGPKLGRESQALLQDLFNSSKARHLGTVQFEFIATRSGQPYQAKSAVGIFASGVAAPEPSPNLGLMSLKSAFVSEPNILQDSETGCWNNLQVGQICLR